MGNWDGFDWATAGLAVFVAGVLVLAVTAAYLATGYENRCLAACAEQGAVLSQARYPELCVCERDHKGFRVEVE